MGDRQHSPDPLAVFRGRGGARRRGGQERRGEVGDGKGRETREKGMEEWGGEEASSKNLTNPALFTSSLV